MLRAGRHVLRAVLFGARPRAAIPGVRCARTKAQKTPIPPPPAPLATRTPIQLRDYQEECIQSVLDYLNRGHNRLGVSLATGSGKTVIFTQLIDRVPAPDDYATQTLILAHRRELVEQAARHCSNAYPSKTVDIEMGNIHASGAADITVASVQSIISGDRIEKFDPRRFKLVLVDEAHHIVAETYLKALDWFGLKNNTNPQTALVGVSATLSRFDGRRLGTVIDHVVYHKDYVEMIEDNWLSSVVFTTVSTKADLSQVKLGANGDFQTSSLSQAVNTDEINEITVRSWMVKAAKRNSTLVFCVDLEHLTGLTATFRRHGIDARYVTGDTPNKLRSQRVDAFRRNEYPVLLNCGVFTEGTDIPNIDCVLLARPTRSRSLLVQMIGRGMRLFPGKKDCHIIDMVAALQTGIFTTPTLLGLDPDALLEQTSAEDAKKIKERKEQEQVREERIAQVAPATAGEHTEIRSTVTFTDYSSIQDLLDDTRVDQAVRQLSNFAWVCVGQDRFALTCNQVGFLIVERNEDEPELFAVKHTQAMPFYLSRKSRSPYFKPQTIAEAPSLEHAIRAADTFAAEKFPLIFIEKWQSWRTKAASEAQIEFLNKFRDDDGKLAVGEINKGKAQDMITRIKHGAKGRFEKMRAASARKEKVQQRHQQAMAKLNPVVTVGPLNDGAGGGDSSRRTAEQN
ncbi:putative mitochondrial ATP-dependent helicase irc3 [Phyllosticta citribraziliensis]|uniref:Mitochondrial ATP-dependent helicase irc3 n=1 Tax=Phyllosticta citribraziliensis TaxID=989973 RepID=A0ABR1LW95_9PEZI